MFQRMSHIMYHPIWTGVNYQRKNNTDSQLNFALRDYKERILFFLQIRTHSLKCSATRRKKIIISHSLFIIKRSDSNVEHCPAFCVAGQWLYPLKTIANVCTFKCMCNAEYIMLVYVDYLGAEHQY